MAQDLPILIGEPFVITAAGSGEKAAWEQKLGHESRGERWSFDTVCIYIYMCICMYICIYVYIYIYIYIFTVCLDSYATPAHEYTCATMMLCSVILYHLVPYYIPLYYVYYSLSSCIFLLLQV